jgi:hypothetical protein
MKRGLFLMLLLLGSFAVAVTGCKKEEAPAEGGAATEAPADPTPAP